MIHPKLFYCELCHVQIYQVRQNGIPRFCAECLHERRNAQARQYYQNRKKK